MEWFLLAGMVLSELILAGWMVVTGSRHDKEKSIVRMAWLAFFVLLLLTGILKGAGRYGILLAVLAVQSVRGIFVLRGKKEKVCHRGAQAGKAAGIILVYALTSFPAVLFPQYSEPRVTGPYEVAEKLYTWEDESRIETYTDTGENRNLTVKFWYPSDTAGGEEAFPLIIFSHGAFGVIDSNYSTCRELASNGYVVASIGHSYHAMFVEDTEGKVTMADMDFVRQVYSGGLSEEEIYENGKVWMKVRVADENFVLDTILAKAAAGQEGPFAVIDSGRIGLFGHSMGGASSAVLGRQREDIGAVILLESTMLGEYTGFQDGHYIFEETPYPKPLLDVYSRDVYEQAGDLAGQEYVNFYVGSHSQEYSYEIFENAGHLNFTDLPLVSPILARLLGVGTVEPGKCIEDVNEMVLAFFDRYLKG